MVSHSNTIENIIRYHQDTNVFSLSSLSKYQKKVDSTGFAIKYVTEGVERYRIEKDHFNVQKDAYLLMHGRKEGHVEIDSLKNVKGICINIDPAIVKEVIASGCIPDSPFPDPEFSSFLDKENFITSKCLNYQTSLGNILKNLNRQISAGDFLEMHINEELFFNIAYHLVTDQTAVFKQLQSVKSIKYPTRLDLFKRLNRGKMFIDAYFNQSLTVNAVAQEASMSDFHFFRLFKSTFGLSPHQYIIKQRLHHAKVLLSEGQNITETAFSCGFPDVYSFSKSFKKYFGVMPSQFFR